MVINFNIRPQTIDFSTRLRGINYRVCEAYFPEPRGDVLKYRNWLEIGQFEACEQVMVSSGFTFESQNGGRICLQIILQRYSVNICTNSSCLLIIQKDN